MSRGLILEDRAMLAAIIVNSLADNVTGGDGQTTLREAILAANSSGGADTISFSAGLNGTLSMSLGQMTISDSLTITGNGATNTIVDGRNLSRIFYVSAGDVTLEKLTLTRGRTTSDFEGGGAIRSISSGSLTVNQSTLSANSTAGIDSDGGAILIVNGAISVNQSTLSANSTTGSYSCGGAIASISGAISVNQATLSGNSTTGNHSSDGGAIASIYGGISVNQTKLSGNSTTGNHASGGGAISTIFGAISVKQSTLSANSTVGFDSCGGAIASDIGAISVSQTTLSGNSTMGDHSPGGAIYSYERGVITVSQSTLSGNSTAGTNAHGGAIYSAYGAAVLISQSTLTNNHAYRSMGGAIFTDSSPITIQNSIVAVNTDDGTAPDVMLPPQATLAVAYSLIGNNKGTGLSATVGSTPSASGNFIGSTASPLNPMLGPLQDNGGVTFTHALQGGLALNHGSNALAVDPTNGNAVLTIDQRGTGYIRVAGGTVDMGAFEATGLSIGFSAGVLTISGTAGNDSIRVLNVGGIIEIDDGYTLVNTSIAAASLTAVTISGLGGNDILRMDSSLDSAVLGTLLGGDDDDTLFSGLGKDTLNGGNGTDTVSYIQATVGVKVSLALVTSQNTVGAGSDTILGVENLAGSNLNDTLTGSTGVNQLSGGVGNDTLTGGLGADALSGGDGDDSLTIDNLDTSVIGGAGLDRTTVSGATSSVSLNLTSGQIETVVASASTFNNVFDATGATWAVNLTGGSGNDTLIGGNLNDTLAGGAGNDSLIGNGGHDTLTGGLGADALNGSDGNDSLTIDNLDTSVIGGVGLDRTTVSGATSSVSLNLTSGQIETVVASASTFNNVFDATGATWAVNLTGGSGNDTLIGGNLNDTLTGGAGNDSLIGNGGNDTLTGGLGADALNGGDDNDSLYFDNFDTSISGGAGLDRVTVSGATGGVSLNLTTGLIETVSASTSIYSNTFDATGATWAVNITGGSGTDVLIGGNLNDTLNGGAGNDTLIGNGGNDLLTGGADIDTISYQTASGPVTVNLTTKKATGAAGTDTLATIENVIGSPFADTITGDLLNNLLDGGDGILGNDTIIGGGGVDSIINA